jgi:hypothetical protein
LPQPHSPRSPSPRRLLSIRSAPVTRIPSRVPFPIPSFLPVFVNPPSVHPTPTLVIVPHKWIILILAPEVYVTVVLPWRLGFQCLVFFLWLDGGISD